MTEQLHAAAKYNTAIGFNQGCKAGVLKTKTEIWKETTALLQPGDKSLPCLDTSLSVMELS